MKKHGKKFAAASAQIPVDRVYTIEEAIPLVQKVKFAKFDETVDMSLRLGVDPKHADQMVRGTVVLPHGLGKSKRVLAIAGGEKQKEATDDLLRFRKRPVDHAALAVAHLHARPLRGAAERVGGLQDPFRTQALAEAHHAVVDLLAFGERARVALARRLHYQQHV